MGQKWFIFHELGDNMCDVVAGWDLPHWKIRKEKFHPPYVNADDLLINFISIIREKL